ncbi:MAG TPA: phosphatidylinositol kinase, partial [Acidimicrobiales bacterium]|nr:phosphatidylinositol kinase [Acidimicrobiales bacterium]
MNLIELLTRGEIEVKGRLPYSSNYSFLCKVAEPESQSDSQEELLAVYKPGSGERPLWDFPEGLYMREVAAYQLSNALGWDLVPETVLRSDGPFGEGSLQRFVDADFSFHYFILLEQPSFHDALRKVAVFDILANNTDRKG